MPLLWSGNREELLLAGVYSTHLLPQKEPVCAGLHVKDRGLRPAKPRTRAAIERKDGEDMKEEAMATAEVISQSSITSGVGFRHSESFAKLTEALLKAQGEFKPVTKDTENPYYKAMYATLDTILEATRPALAKHGLVVIQSPRTEERTVVITTLLAHTSGEWIADDLALPAEQAGKDGKPRFDPQSVGSAITYGRRYAYQSFLGIAAEEDDDANTFVKPPERKAAQSTTNERPATATNGGHFGEFITPEQKRKFWAIAKAAGKTDVAVRNYLGSEGMEHSEEMLKKDFDRHCTWAADKDGLGA